MLGGRSFRGMVREPSPGLHVIGSKCTFFARNVSPVLSEGLGRPVLIIPGAAETSHKQDDNGATVG